MSQEKEKTLEKFIRCQQSAKTLLGADYITRIQPRKDILSAVMKENQVKEVQALLILSQKPAYKKDPMGQVLFMAACAELIQDKVSV
ncbi:MAG: hypothetical protein ACRBFS_20880 [Aureispira sp.]